MTGKQAVELFGQGRHLGKATFVYLNKTPNRHYRPYDLTVVPKHKVRFPLKVCAACMHYFCTLALPTYFCVSVR